jgi:nitroimidazol reductase NimA-like FMN-containing flavoprotein (pyridoxamine 5'-phosphate oxidase superfamily)
MRRAEREITDRKEIDTIIRRARVCRLGLAEDGQPYVIPMTFGYDGRAVYFHCATQGRKLDILRKNPDVCLEFDVSEEILEAERACGWGMKYHSVIALGTAVFLETPEEKRNGLRILMAQYSNPNRSFSFPDAALSRVIVIKVGIDQLTGKRSV